LVLPVNLPPSVLSLAGLVSPGKGHLVSPG